MQHRFGLFLLLIFLVSTSVFCQDVLVPKSKERRLVVLPAPFRNPETRFGLILGGVYTFKLDTAADSRPSQLQAGVGYTQNKQVLTYLNTQLVTPGRKYLINTEFGYYDYFYPYGGVGFDQPKNYNENYYVRFPRLRGTVLKRFGENVYAGPKISFDAYTIRKTETGGLLSGNSIPGSKGGLLLQYGIVANFDNRDNIFSAYTGWLIETGITGASSEIGGKYNFVRYLLNVQHYLPLRSNMTLALNATSELYYGNPPFNGMAYLGGARNMRGFYEGRYRDKKAISAQSELRWRLLPWFGIVGFASSGTIAEEFQGLRIDRLLVTSGAGLRFTLNQKDRTVFRIDYGQTNKGYGNFYVSFLEAF